MRKFKNVLALILALTMLLSCVSVASAAGDKEKPAIGVTQTNESSAKDKGALSVEFKQQNLYQYADDEIVRVIVVLESAPEADIEGTAAEKSAYRGKLDDERSAVRKAMVGIDYEVAYEFTALLNGFSCDVAYGDIEAIAAIDGVAAVHIANSYAAPELEQPENYYSGLMTGNAYSNQSGYNGSGIVIAVLDTGLRTTHEAFQVYENMPLTETLTEEDLAHAVAPGQYISAKVPFAYDYAEKDNDVTDYSGHGTHVSGTALGYAESEEGVIIMSGAAPAAQLVSMKIFKDAGGGTSSDIYFYALEDAYRLGVDVVNMSIGAQNGFTYDEALETEVFGNIYKRMEAAGIVLCVSAGNEYSMANYSSVGYIGSEYADYGTVGTPSTYEGSVSVASVENYAYPDYVIQVGGETVPFIDSCADGEHGWIDNFADSSVEFVVLKTYDEETQTYDIAYGAESDYEGIDVTGKIVVASRGGLYFQEIVDNAANAGAIGVIVCNNVEGLISMSISPFAIPAVSVQVSAREIFLAAEEGDTLYVPAGKSYVENPNGYLMSDFSNWGTSPMLTIDPTITSVGGYVYSSVPTADDAYEVYSGTSMASPNAAGTFACVLQMLQEDGYYYDEEIGDWTPCDKAQCSERAKALLESTGIILYDADDYIYSVRKQGAGLANSSYAIDTYLNAAYISNPIQELGDDPEKTGVYTMELELVNEGYSDVVYDDFGTYILFDYVYEVYEGTYANTLTSDYLFIDEDGYADITYTVDGEEVTEVTLYVGSSITVTVTITLSEDAKAVLDEQFPNGTYVEGYVSFSVEEELRDIDASSYETHATFLAFYGDWTQAPAMETLNSFDYMEANYIVNADLGNGTSYADYGYTAADILWNFYGDWYTDINWAYTMDSYTNKLVNYLGANPLDLDYTEFMKEHASFSTAQTDGTWYYYDGMYLVPNLIRNVRHIVMTVSNAETGEVYYVDDTEYIPKDAWDTESDEWQNYSVFAWDGTDSTGKTYVPSGTVANVSFDIQLPYGEADDIWQEDVWDFQVTVDYTAPVIESVVYDEEANTLTVQASDENYLAGIYLCSTDYTTIYAQQTFSSDVKGESFEAVFDLSEIDADVLYVTAIDYASNEMEELQYFFEAGQEATITLVTPFGTEEVFCLTGDTFVFEEVETVEGYTFEGWTDAQYEASYGEDIETFYIADEELLITETEYTFYALYAKGAYYEYDELHYYYDTPDNFSGYWAFIGFPYSNGYDLNDPIAMGSSLESVRIADLEDGEVIENMLEFTTNETGIMYYIAYLESYDAYYIVNAENGMVLTCVNGAMGFYDTLYLQGLWKMEIDEYGCTLCYNYADSSAILLYNDESGNFEIFDDTVPYYGSYYPSQYFSLYLYRCADSRFALEYYTTEIDVCGIRGEHTYGEWSTVSEATCTEDGADTRTCVCCGEVETRINEAFGHFYGGWIAMRQPSCTEPGLDARYCATCDNVETRETLPANGHSYGEWTVTVEPTCTEKGEETRYCAECDAFETREVELAEHTYGEWMITKAATCTEKGEELRVCVCGGTETREVEPIACPSELFGDLDTTKWYHEATDFVLSNGYMVGVKDGVFAPQNTVSRAMIVTVLYRAAGSPAVEAPSTFVDVPAGVWYSDAVAWAQANGIVRGISDTEFDPNGNVTREQIATILWRYAGEPEAEAEMNFTDAGEISTFAEKAMVWAVSEGIYEGNTKGELNPTGYATRVELAAVLMRYLTK